MDLGNILGEFSGTRLPDDFTVQDGQAVWFRFVTDEDITTKGFSLSWESYTGKWAIVKIDMIGQTGSSYEQG